MKRSCDLVRVTFSIESRSAGPLQLEAGDRLFRKLTDRAWSAANTMLVGPAEPHPNHAGKSGEGGQAEAVRPPEPPSLTNRGASTYGERATDAA